jgi:hypothetical protein
LQFHSAPFGTAVKSPSLSLLGTKNNRFKITYQLKQCLAMVANAKNSLKKPA